MSKCSRRSGDCEVSRNARHTGIVAASNEHEREASSIEHSELRLELELDLELGVLIVESSRACSSQVASHEARRCFHTGRCSASSARANTILHCTPCRSVKDRVR